MFVYRHNPALRSYVLIGFCDDRDRKGAPITESWPSRVFKRPSDNTEMIGLVLMIEDDPARLPGWDPVRWYGKRWNDPARSTLPGGAQA